jgi:hypothetical protein
VSDVPKDASSPSNGFPRTLYQPIMSGDRKSDDSLEKEIAYEDITIAAGESSKRKREKKKKEEEETKKKEEEKKEEEEEKKKEKNKEEEEEKQEQMKEAMLQAGENSRTKRGYK